MNNPDSSSSFDLPSVFSSFWGYRLALKIALFSASVTAAGAGLTWILSDGFSLWMGGLLVAISFTGSYTATVTYASRRLELARGVLKNLRKHEFETLDLAQVERGDEINDIIRQVYRTGRVLEREFEELKKVENYRREFLGNISHELKTPIFSIRGFAETLNEGALDDPEVNRSFIEKIIRNADRLSNLANDLAEISRFETGERELNIDAFNLKRLINDVVESVEPQARKRSVKISKSFEKNLPPTLGDPAQIRQVMVNLVDNAIKYSEKGGKVTVKASTHSPNSVQVVVGDRGIGIGKEDIARLTERFFRVDKSRSRAAGGTGLGLAIVKHILAAHDVELQIRSKPGKGSSFSFDLPIAVLEKENIAPDTRQAIN